MKTYKDLDQLRKRAIKNNGEPVKIWDDDGIKVAGKIYRQMEFGSMGYNFTGNCYVTFRNVAKRGFHPSYAYRDNIDYDNDKFITIEYDLIDGNIFKFILIREDW